MAQLEKTSKRGYGAAHQRVRKIVLARDVNCTEPGCHRRSVRAHHDPPLAERNPPASDRYNPAKMRGVCEPHHRQLTGRQQSRRLRRQAATRDEQILSAPPSIRVSERKTPRVWEGAIRAPMAGPCQVITASGEFVTVPSGVRYQPPPEGPTSCPRRERGSPSAQTARFFSRVALE